MVAVLGLAEDIVVQIFHECFTAEVLSSHTVAPQRNKASSCLLAFSQTCREWRSLALRTPSLWTAVPMHLPQLASLFLQRTESVPVVMIWDLSSGTHLFNKHGVKWRAVLQDRPAIRDIDVRCISTTSYIVPDIIKTCVERSPVLPTRLHLRLYGARVCQVFTAHGHFLTYLELENYFPSPQCVFSSLTTLVMKRRTTWAPVNAVELFGFLARSPSLRNLTLHSCLGISDGAGLELNFPDQPIEMPELHILELHDSLPRVTRALSCLRMPKLFDLRVTDQYSLISSEYRKKTDLVAIEDLCRALVGSPAMHPDALPVCSISVNMDGEISLARRAAFGVDERGFEITIFHPASSVTSKFFQTLDSDVARLETVHELQLSITGEFHVSMMIDDVAEHTMPIGPRAVATVFNRMSHLTKLSLARSAGALGLLALFDHVTLCPQITTLVLHNVCFWNGTKSDENNMPLGILASVVEDRTSLQRIVFVYCMFDGHDIKAEKIALQLGRRGNDEMPLGDLKSLREIEVIDHRRSVWRAPRGATDELH
jgi:hypothetical protein